MHKYFSPVEAIGGMPISANYAADLAAETHNISPDKARQMIADFSADITGSYEAFPVCETFNAATIRKLIDAPGAIGLRVYNGIDPDGTAFFVLASVNADGTDITMDDVAEGLLAEDGQRYPRKPKPKPKPDPKKPGADGTDD